MQIHKSWYTNIELSSLLYSVAATLLLVMAVGIAMLFIQTPSSATSTKSFKAGDIMSDGVMGNSNTMTESQIKSFLKSKNPCDKTVASAGGDIIDDSTSKAHWASTPSITYQITGGKKGTTNGKFVCLADAKFNGETAPHIIYEAAKYYSVNPEVLIVLLQKEQSLVLDDFPNSLQYAAATGYNCPDGGSGCSKSDAGFKSQVRGASLMFDEVLTNKDLDGDHFITNYPVGTNTVYYNPGPCKTTDGNGKCTVWYGQYGNKPDITYCGSSKVDIKNRATSALYRYTPYQPNPATLAAGWPSPGVSCGAYGNLNFYMYFTKWFSSTHALKYSPMKYPRNLQATADLKKTSTRTLEDDGTSVVKDQVMAFDTSIKIDGVLYLRTTHDTREGVDYGIPYDMLKSVPVINYKKLHSPIIFKATKSLKKTSLQTIDNIGASVKKGQKVTFDSYVTIDGTLYYRTEHDTKINADYGIPASDLYTSPKISSMKYPRKLQAKKALSKISLHTTIDDGTNIDKGLVISFSKKAKIGGITYLVTSHDVKLGIDYGIPYSDLKSVPELHFSSMKRPREMRATTGLSKTSLYTMEDNGTNIDKDQVMSFNTVINIDGELYLRTNHDTRLDLAYAIPYSQLASVPTFKFSPMKYPRKLKAKTNLSKTSLYTMKQDGASITKGQVVSFNTVINIDGELYLRTNHDTRLGIAYAIPYSQLTSV